MSRQFKCIELTPNTALLLREAIRPYANLSHARISTGEIEDFCERLYVALIKLEHEEIINISMSLADCFLINNFLSIEDNEDARPLLRQTWAVTYEYSKGYPPDVESAVNDILAGLSESPVEETENAEGNKTN